MKNFRNLILTGFVFALIGCVSLQREGMEVQVISTSKVLPHECKNLGKLESFSMWGTQQAMAYLRNEAGFNGATHVVTNELVHSFWGFTYKAQAFKCSMQK